MYTLHIIYTNSHHVDPKALLMKHVTYVRMRQSAIIIILLVI